MLAPVRLALMIFLLLAALITRVSSTCECGYGSIIDTTLQPGSTIGHGVAAPGISERGAIDTLLVDHHDAKRGLDEASHFVWTDLLETDFFHLDNISKDTDWQVQNYSVTAQESRGPLGINFDLNGVTLNRIPDENNWTGPGENGGDPGLQIAVQATVTPDGFTRSAQLNSYREDMLWGSYRALLKLPSVAGTCSAFFWYFNNSQEIDMEILSSQFNKNNNTFMINLVHQSPQSASQGFSVIGKDYQMPALPFDPTTGFHEYRIDYLPNKIIFYGDRQVIGVMNTTVDPQPGHLILTHWSNGDKGWSGGPPPETAVLSVGYVRAYFNSSNHARNVDYDRRCLDPTAPTAICLIHDYNDSVGAANPGLNGSSNSDIDPNHFFFFQQDKMTPGQIIYRNMSISFHNREWSILKVFAVSIFVCLASGMFF